jgi:hypothetical protein
LIERGVLCFLKKKKKSGKYKPDKTRTRGQAVVEHGRWRDRRCRVSVWRRRRAALGLGDLVRVAPRRRARVGICALQLGPQRRLVLQRGPHPHKFNPTLVTADPEGEPILLSQDGGLYRLEMEPVD